MTATEASPDIERSGGWPPERHRWIEVMLLWVSSVIAYALTLALLQHHSLNAMQRWEMARLREALRVGDLGTAKAYAEPLAYVFPTQLVIQFALLGLAVITLAWAGRRALAVAVPLLVAVAAADLRTAVLGESEWGLWASALEPDGWLGESPPAGPLYLGLAVQLGLLLTPLIAAPARSAVVPLARAVRRAALPAAFVTIAALALIQFPSTDELYAVPLMALGLSVVAAAIVTGAGALWLRIPAAVLVPAFIHPALVEDGPHYLGPTTVQMLMVACGSSVVVLGTLAAPKAHSILMRIRSVDHSDSVPATSA